MACEFCAKVLELVKSQRIDQDFGLLDDFMALECRSCQPSREKIQTIIVEITENHDYDKTTSSLRLQKWPETATARFLVTHSRGSVSRASDIFQSVESSSTPR